MPLALHSSRPVCYASRKLETGARSAELWAVALVEGVPEQALYAYAYEFESAPVAALSDLVLHRFREPPSPRQEAGQIDTHLLFFTSEQLGRYGASLRVAWTCRGCGASRDRMARCGSCGTCYCSAACQLLHWGSHKGTCPRIQATHEAGRKARESCGRCLPTGTRYHGVLSSYDTALLLHLAGTQRHGEELMQYASGASAGVYEVRHTCIQSPAIRVPSALTRVNTQTMEVACTTGVLDMTLGSVYDRLTNNRSFRLAMGASLRQDDRPARA